MWFETFIPYDNANRPARPIFRKRITLWAGLSQLSYEFEYFLAEPVVLGVDAGDFGNVVVSARASSSRTTQPAKWRVSQASVSAGASSGT
jgi:hypothetical protein